MTTLTVGSGQQYQTIAAAVAASAAGDTVAVQAGTYTNDFARVWHALTLQAVGGMVKMVATIDPPNGKGILDTYASTVVEGFSFSGSRVPDGNGAGIRSNAGDLTIRDCLFSNNQNGILVNGNPDVTVTVEGSEFAFNGAGDGYTHNLYVGAVKALVIDNSYFHDAHVGHEVKSRALSTTITNSRIIDGPSSDASYSIDLPDGGVGVIQNNVIEKGANAQNQTIVHFGGEHAAYAGSSLTMTGNVIVNDRSPVTGLNNASGAPASVTGNTLYGITSAQFGEGEGANTVVTGRPALDLSTRLAAPAPAPVVPQIPVPLADTPDGLSYVDFGRAGAVFASGRVLHVGANEAFTSLQAALAASEDGDTVQVDAGTYVDDFATARHAVIIEGVGGMANFVATVKGENGVGLLDVQASVTVRNLTFTGARSYDGNGAGMRVRGGDVTVVNCVFTNNDVSILAHAPATTIGIFDTEIAGNGNGDKSTHNLNIGAVNSFTMENTYVHGGIVAHEVNDRAFFSRIEDNRIVDTDASNASFGINLGRGGNALIRNNQIEKGPHAANGILVHVGGEGPTYANTNVQVVGNTLVSTVVNYDHPYTFFVVADGTASGGVAPSVTVMGNTFVGGVPGSDQARGTVSQGATVASSAMISRAVPWVAPAAIETAALGADTLSLTFDTATLFAPAQILVALDGVAVGGGAVQNGTPFTIHGNWAGGAHQLTVTEINGHYGTSLQGGNTRLVSASLNGVAQNAGDNALVWSPYTMTVSAPPHRAIAAEAAMDTLAQTPLFDATYYLAHNPDVAAAGVDALQHFETTGWTEGRDPSAAFSIQQYIDAYADIGAAHVNPLLHYVQYGQAEGRQAFAVEPPVSPEAALFDATYYMAHNPDVAAAGVNAFRHFQTNGWMEGRDPSAAFSDSKYLDAYADVRDAHIDPLMHYALFGRAEGRMIFAVDTQPAGPATEAQLFDADYYLGHNADVMAAHVDPLLHYTQYGWMEGRDPSATFSTTEYLNHYSDVAAAHIDPLAHYAQFGQAEGRMAYAAA